jgi:hypothetical protein
MIRLVLITSLLVGCRVSLEDSGTGGTTSGRTCTVSTTSAPCMEAASGMKSDLAWLQANVFTPSCSFSGCHNGDSSRQGQIDLRDGMSHAHLVNFASKLDPTRKLVVPNDVEASYLMLMLHDFSPDMANPPGSAPPDSVGYMPQGNPPLCCQKLDAIERWIMAGAPTN